MYLDAPLIKRKYGRRKADLEFIRDIGGRMKIKGNSCIKKLDSMYKNELEEKDVCTSKVAGEVQACS